jgi:hypothetical protein
MIEVKENDLRVKLKKYMFDASFVLSSNHLNRIIEKKKGGYIASSIKKLKEYEKFKDAFIFFIGHKKDDTIKKSYEAFKEFNLDILEKYSCETSRHAEDVRRLLENFDLPEIVKEIVADEFLFLIEHSALLSATKNIFNAFKKFFKEIVIIIDMSNKLYNLKKEFFYKLGGLKYFVGVSIAVLSAEIFRNNPKLKWLAQIGNIIIAVADP